MTGQEVEKTLSLKVFQEPPDGLDGDWTHGVLLVGIRHFQPMEWLEAARVYSDTALHLIDRALADGVRWDDAHPALFMCRHSLELYLKAALPDWREFSRKNGHDLEKLIARLTTDLTGRYRDADIERLGVFLREFAEFDTKAMVFRFPDGGSRSARNDVVDEEVWVDFRALREAIGDVFRALDLICLGNLERAR